MLKGFDHAILLVPDAGDLENAVAGLESLGFAITRRDDETNDTAKSENRLICFEDGSYIEILSFRDRDYAHSHRFAAMLDQGAGWADYSLLAEDVEACRDRLVGALPGLGPVKSFGNRLRDGTPWSVGMLVAGIGAGRPGLPFVVEDKTAHNIRVPDAHTRHSLAVTGIAGATVVTADLAEAESGFTAMFGPGTEIEDLAGGERGRRYAVGGGWVELRQPGQGPSAFRDHLDRRGESLFAIVLSRREESDLTWLDRGLTCGARIGVTGGLVGPSRLRRGEA